jgi:hypothetical protein
MLPSYENEISELEKRIATLIKNNQVILTLTDPFELLSIKGFDCDDLKPSFMQVSNALGNSIIKWNEQHETN